MVRPPGDLDEGFEDMRYGSACWLLLLMLQPLLTASQAWPPQT